MPKDSKATRLRKPKNPIVGEFERLNNDLGPQPFILRHSNKPVLTEFALLFSAILK